MDGRLCPYVFLQGGSSKMQDGSALTDIFSCPRIPSVEFSEVSLQQKQ